MSMNERRLSIIVFVLFSSWMLAFPFEGQILYAIAGKYNLDPHRMVFGAVAATAVGLLFWGFLIRSKKAAKRLLLCSTAICIIASACFFYPPSHLWIIASVSYTHLDVYKRQIKLRLIQMASSMARIKINGMEKDLKLIATISAMQIIETRATFLASVSTSDARSRVIAEGPVT